MALEWRGLYIVHCTMCPVLGCPNPQQTLRTWRYSVRTRGKSEEVLKLKVSVLLLISMLKQNIHFVFCSRKETLQRVHGCQDGEAVDE